MNLSHWVLAWISALLAGCAPQSAPESKPETVSIALYHPSSGLIALKSDGDLLVLSTGETVLVDSNRLLSLLGYGHTSLPVPKDIVLSDWNQWLDAATRTRGRGHIAASIWRDAGVICIGDKCKKVLAVCPKPQASMPAEAKCQAPPTDR
jgi:hypothetical protein